MKYYTVVRIIAVLLLFAKGTIASPTENINAVWPPGGGIEKLQVTNDIGLSSVVGEKNGGKGFSRYLKLKGPQELVLVDGDFNRLKGSLISGALLHIRSASPGISPLGRIGVSTLASPWKEGGANSYRPSRGNTSYSQAEYLMKDWSYPGSTIMDVVFGRGHTIWKFADASQPGPGGWQAVAVAPEVIAAAIAGISSGLCVYDEVGSIWSIHDGRFKYTYFPNRFFYSRESLLSAPWFEIRINGRDTISPGAVKNVKAEVGGLIPGQALLSWETPVDDGGGKTLGFFVRYSQGGKEHEMPRYLVPMAGQEGQTVRMHVQDLPFQPGETVVFNIQPVDSCGNVGPVTAFPVVMAGPRPGFALDSIGVKPFPDSETLPELCGVKVSVMDQLDKVDPRSGVVMPAQKEGYKSGNHLFSAKERKIRLQAAGNETVCFLLNLEGKEDNIDIDFSIQGDDGIETAVFHSVYVKSMDDSKQQPVFWADPLIPLSGPFSIPSGMWPGLTDQINHSLLCELYVPHNVSSGDKKGKLIVSIGNEKVVLDVCLKIWNFTLPDKLSFVPELNAYAVVSPYKGYDYYRLAHRHRTCLNRLPYGWHGRPSFAPEWDGTDFEWQEWDSKVGPLVDGSAFADMPRKNEPVDVMYLPFSENWPVDLYEHYTPSYWPEDAFSNDYKSQLKRSFSAFALHCNQKKWNNTIFQFYLNNKVYHRQKYKQASAPWIFDEPVNTQDFWALRWYGLLWKDAVKSVSENTRMWFRGDVSYPQNGKNILWDVMDIEYIGQADDHKIRMKKDEQMVTGQSFFSEYGALNPVDSSNTQPCLWCLSAWANGASGILPWQTIGNENSWKKADQAAILYPHPTGPKPSLRLKALMRGQQDVEYLELFCDLFGIRPSRMGGWLKEHLSLTDMTVLARHGDAGTPVFSVNDTVLLWEMRYSLGKKISSKAPQYRRRIPVDDDRDHNGIKNPDFGYVPVSPPHVDPMKPECDNFEPSG